MATEGGGTPTPVREGPSPAFQVTVREELGVEWDKPPVPAADDAPRRAVRHDAGPSVAEQIYTEGYRFDFFQAVRVIERLFPERRSVGQDNPPAKECVRFRVRQSLTFPPSAVYEVRRPEVHGAVPTVTVPFLGLTGPLGVLPRHYTELIMRLEREAKGERGAVPLRDWLDLFNHRFISLFFRAWEKYRFYILYERGSHARRDDPDPFTTCLLSLIGLEALPLRNRLQVGRLVPDDEGPKREVLARVQDWALLHYSGFLAHRPRCAVSLEALLNDYFQLPIRVLQFQGQWLVLEPANQSRLGTPDGNNLMGVNLVAGERVWDVQNKIRIRLGPLDYEAFNEFLPHREPTPERKGLFLLSHLVRLYVGPEIDFDVQVVLRKEDVPPCQLAEGDGFRPQLGRNTWASSLPFGEDAEDAVFEGEEAVLVGGPG